MEYKNYEKQVRICLFLLIDVFFSSILVKKNNDTTHLPLESCYLGRSALKMLIGDIPNPSKCFSLIRKAKSARIRQDLLEKSAQTSKVRRASTSWIS